MNITEMEPRPIEYQIEISSHCQDGFTVEIIQLIQYYEIYMIIPGWSAEYGVNVNGR